MSALIDLVARKARAKGLTPKPWVKTSLAPGSQVVSDYLEKAGLQADLDAMGYNLVGFGCTTCIGNSGPLPEVIDAAITAKDITVAAVLSGHLHQPFEDEVGGVIAEEVVLEANLGGRAHVPHERTDERGNLCPTLEKRLDVELLR